MISPLSSAGRGGDQLERRTGRVQALGRAVGERRAVVGVLQALVHRCAHALREHVGVVARVAAEPDHLAAARVHRDEPARQPVALERRLAGLLHVEVDRQPQPLARLGVAHRQLALGPAHRVDLHPAGAVAPAQVAVVLELDAGLAHAVAERHVRVAGQLRAASRSPRRSCRTGARRSRRAGTCAGTPARPRRPGTGPGSPAGTGRCSRPTSVLSVTGLNGSSLTSRLILRRIAPRRPAERVAEPAVHAPAPRLLVRQPLRQHLDDERGAVVDQQRAAAVDDLAARRLDLHLAHAVVVRLGEVLVARQHLQVPEAEEDHREQHQRDAAEDRHAQRELRRDDHALVALGQVHLGHLTL